MSKILYEKPTADILEVRFGGEILQTSGDVEVKNWTSGESNWFNDED